MPGTDLVGVSLGVIFFVLDGVIYSAALSIASTWTSIHL